MTVELDRYTAYSAVGGALAGAKDYPLVTALGVTVALELWENYRRCGRLPPDDAQKFAANVVVAMGAWWLAKRAMP